MKVKVLSHSQNNHDAPLGFCLVYREAHHWNVLNHLQDRHSCFSKHKVLLTMQINFNIPFKLHLLKQKNQHIHCTVKDLSSTSEVRCTKQFCNILAQNISKVSRLKIDAVLLDRCKDKGRAEESILYSTASFLSTSVGMQSNSREQELLRG